jgi:hypothetical protein
MTKEHFTDLNELASHLRTLFEPSPPEKKQQSQKKQEKVHKFILLYAYNGTGKTRLAGAFKDEGKQVNEDGETTQRDTLYFNAFTEDLFSWQNDLENDNERYLTLHPTSQFFAGLEELEMDNRIRPILLNYADFDFKLDKAPLNNALGEQIGEQHIVRFFRTLNTPSGSVDVNNIKISRGEENLFRWCFFLAILQLVLDGDENYKWVKYVYIDDPISSLDESNAISVANHLSQKLVTAINVPKTVISTHHTLFFNVLCNELKDKSHLYFVKNAETQGEYILSKTGNKPFLHHLAALSELNKVRVTGDIRRHHFNMLRCIMEQTAIYCGLKGWKECIKSAADGLDKELTKRMIDVMSHADYLINEPEDPNGKLKDDFRQIFMRFVTNHPFNKELYEDTPAYSSATPVTESP